MAQAQIAGEGAPCRMAAGLHLSLVTLGVDDLRRSIAFYEALGLPRRLKAAEGVAFFEAGGAVLALYPRHQLAADAGVLNGRPGAFGGIVLSCNRPSREAVDSTIAAVIAAGGKALRAADTVFWGGYVGYVADPDGHPWEVAYNPDFGLDPDGRLRVPD